MSDKINYWVILTIALAGFVAASCADDAGQTGTLLQACGIDAGDADSEGESETDTDMGTDSSDAGGEAVPGDSDGDGVPDDSDNCPDVPNPLQEDADWDRIGDVCDGCPLDYNNDTDNDEVCGNVDCCGGTVIPEDVPTIRLGTNRWALVDDDGIFDTKKPNGKGPSRSYTIHEEYGCSCEQIIEEKGLGEGHTKFGCSISAMDDFEAEGCGDCPPDSILDNGACISSRMVECWDATPEGVDPIIELVEITYTDEDGWSKPADCEWEGECESGPCCDENGLFRPDDYLCRASAGVCDEAEYCTGDSSECPADSFQPSTIECRSSVGVCDEAEFCTGKGVECPSDGFQPSTTECRGSAGICDEAEFCTGSGAECPVDGFHPSTTECRSSAGTCDDAEYCTGADAACPINVFHPSTTECRTSAGICDEAEYCTGAAAECPADVFQPSTTECRTSAGICDDTEFCTGEGVECPADGFQPSTTECRSSVGICDEAEFCTGEGAECPTDVFQPSTTECRTSAGICDEAEYCTGSGAECPADGFLPSTTECRSSAGICDEAEYCTGSGAECPTDGFQPSTIECRTSVGICDEAEFCTGSGAECPVDIFQPSTTECRGSAGICDDAEFCTGSGAECPADVFRPSTTECRGSAGICDEAEYCTGLGAECPTDGFQPSTTECRTSAGICDEAEFCTGAGAECPSDGFQPSTTECRGSAGICDEAEYCTGEGAECPADGFQPTTTECRGSAGICDEAEFCTGSDADCPVDGFQPSTTECRASAGICDESEYCTGSGAECPVDGFQPSTTECRTSAGICDEAEFCTGSDADCPVDGFQPSTTECRASDGICDEAEFCTGEGAECPADGFQPSTTECRTSAGICDEAEYCTGSDAECPTDGFQPSTTECRGSAGICDESEFCTGEGAECPVDGFQPLTTECRGSAGICDEAEYCTGSGAECPVDGFQPSTTECRPSAGACDIAEFCSGSSAACPADQVLPAAIRCSAEPTSAEYGCESSDCGADAQKREQYAYCDGENPECGTGNLIWEDWQVFQECGENDLCGYDETSSWCITCPTGCSNGTCGCVFLVDIDVQTPGDGTSWDNAFDNVQDGIAAAAAAATSDNPCDVWVAEGVYYIYEFSNSDTIQLQPYVEVYGGFAGDEAGRDDRDWQINTTVLDGYDSAIQTSQVCNVTRGADNSVIDGFTIRNGRVQSGCSIAYGGGMYNNNVSPMVANCTFEQNYTPYYGGGMYNGNGASPHVKNCVFQQNTAGSQGGGIYNSSSSMRVEDSLFQYNRVEQYTFGGAGIMNFESDVEIIRCVLRHNTATLGHGGAISNNLSEPIISNTVIYDNEAGGYGGGGIFNYTGSPTIINCTIINNTGRLMAGGVFDWYYSQSIIQNTILWGNRLADGALSQIGTYVSDPIVSYSDVQGGYSGMGNIDADPLFLSESNWNLRLSGASPCIDAADGDAAPDADIEGNARFDNPDVVDTGVGDPTFVDMGAYEARSCEGVVCEFGCDGGYCRECDTGPCCPNGFFSSPSTVCDTTTEQKCQEAACNGLLYSRFNEYLCTGSSSQCPAEPTIWYDTVEDVCFDGVCIEDGPFASCQTCEFECEAGHCIDGIDLVPSQLDVSGVTTDIHSLTATGIVTIGVENRGNIDSDNGYFVLLFEDLNANNIYDAADGFMEESIVPFPHASGQTLYLDIAMNAPLSFAGNMISVFVDSREHVAETHEDNNVATNMAFCEHIPPVGQFSPTREWSWTQSDVFPEWVEIIETAAVAQLTDDNGDGAVDEQDTPDVVFLTNPGAEWGESIIRVASGDTGQELFAITDPDYRALVGSAIAIGDIDNDGLPEIVGYNRQNKTAMAFEHDGTPKWLSSEPTCAAIPAIADLEGDGSPEIVMGNVVYNNDGSKKWSVSDEVCSVYHYMMPCVANLDLKTGNEVIMGHKAFLADGTLLWEAEGMWPGYARTCAIANFDDDPFPEVVFVGAGWITLFEHDGTSKWGTPFVIQSGGRGGAPSVADCDGDGAPEIVAAGASRLVVVNADRTLLWEAPIKDSSSGMTSCTVFDFEGDGEAEVVYQDEDYLRVYKGANGEVLFQEELHTGTLVEMPIVVDIDGDNNAEIVAVENTILFGGDSAGLHVFGDANDTWVNTRKIWNQHTYHITNVNDDGSIPRYEANNWHTFNNYRQNQMFNPLGCTDLSASYARIESTGEPPVLRIAARIGNSGALGVPAGVNVAFYEGDPDAGGLLLGVRQTDVSLDPGQYLEMTLDYTGELVGTTVFYVVVDDDGTGAGAIRETDEDNNTAYSAYDFCTHGEIEPCGSDEGECEPGTRTCDSGFWGACTGLIGPGAEICDGLDNDCDATTDEGCACVDGWTSACGVETGECATGISTCVSGQWEDCMGAIGPSEEICDGFDNDCDAQMDEGLTQPCSTICAEGLIRCENGAWQQCDAQQPVDEMCDNLDNDCDDEVDENLSRSCSTACGDGVEICIFGVWLECDAQKPSVEVCDGVDNDCNGVTDEGCECIDGETAPCGSDVGECSPGTATCIDGSWEEECTGEVGPTDEICDGLDNDCDAQMDEFLTQPCSTVCGDGVEQCVLGVWQDCDAPQPEPEICDGFDNNCDGVTDERCGCIDGETAVCGTGVGQCQTGLILCIDGMWQEECNGEIPPAEEICDGLDNDCDGAADDNVTRACSSICGAGVETCMLGEWGDCDAALPEAEICDAEDNDCDGFTDEDLIVDCSNPCSSGENLCINGTWQGCTADELPPGYAEECFVGIGACTVFGTIGCDELCDAVEGTPVPEVCFDGIDNDCNGETDEGCPEDPNPPTVQLALEDGLEITGPYSIVGTAADGEFLAEWALEVAAVDSDEWWEVASGTELVDNAELHVLDPTIMTGGIYKIRLWAADGVGNESMTEEFSFLVLGQRKVGQFTFAFEDITLPVQGIPVTVTRKYDSFDKTQGDFGVGWTMALGAGVKIQRTKPLGEDWERRTVEPYPWGGFAIETDNPAKVLVTYADGTQDRFEVRARFAHPWIPDDVVMEFEPVGKTRSQLYALGESMLHYDSGMIVDYLGNPTVAYDPDMFLVVTQEGVEMAIWRSEGLKSIADPNGNTVYLGDYSIIHSTGKMVFFGRDEEGRIEHIFAPDIPDVRYTYDEQGDLRTFTDQAGETWTYGYDDDHNLVSIIDPRGMEILTVEFDEDGRMISTADGFGEVTSVTHDIENATEIITDRNGNVTQYVYDEVGNITREIGPDGSVKELSYDEFDNKLTETRYDELDNPYTTTWSYVYNGDSAFILEKTETDPMGHSMHWTYDERGNVLVETDANDNVTSYEYDTRGNITRKSQTVDGVIVEEVFTYDSGGNLETITDAEDHTEEATYDSYGNPETITDAEGHIVEYTYDERGNKETEFETVTTDDGPVTITTQYEYDDANRLFLMIDHEGRATRTEYNEIGKRSAMIDPDGRRTEFFYDVNGNLFRTLYFDGTEETYTYDANGNTKTYIDKLGRTTTYDYDELDRLVKTIYPDSTFTSTEYNLLGRVKADVDANGNRTEYEYDAAGRKELERNALVQETAYEYDAAGNVTMVTGPDGNAVEYVYDELNRQKETIYPDDTFESVAYDNVGRIIARTDPNGNTTQYEYDGVGRLTKVIDAIMGETIYTYDERGNKLSQIDANAHTTSWGYDSMGRKVRRTLPLAMSETWTYNNRGLEESHTDFNGDTTYAFYDSHGRLDEVFYPDFSREEYQYTVLGQRYQVIDSRGTTTYTYDSRDRPSTVMNPNGSSLGYTYDAAGKRLTVTVPSGTTTYTYDALNRIETVTDPDSGVTTYTYHLNGKVDIVTYPNSTVADHDYDTLGRLTYLENRKSDSTIISSYAYTPDNNGNRTKIIENDGRTIDYTYDPLNRLHTETITNPDLTIQTFTYDYDAVGNRLTKETCIGDPPVCETVSYMYNDNNQLGTESSPSEVINYLYDSNGNTVEKAVDAVVETIYTYDYRNRLVEADTGEDLVQYAYDVDSIRIQKTVNTDVINYLVDKNRRYAQVLEERDASNTLIVSYIHGNDLISQHRGTSDAYYHYDGLGSTRALTDPSETVTDSYTYEAFGDILAQAGGSVNAYLFTGEQFDPVVSFYYLRARYYNPGVGRFVTMDSWEDSRLRPITLNKYLYADGNPVMGVDPSGHMSLMETSTVQSVSAFLRTVGMRASAAYATGGSALGKFWNDIGRYASGVCRTVLRSNPNALVEKPERITNVYGPEATRRLDWFVTVGNKMATIEVKYSLPQKIGTKQFERVIGQLKSAVAAGRATTGQVVLWTLRAPRSIPEITRIHDELGSSAADVQFVHGVSGLFRWLELYFGSWL